jgi:hypothetical protein
MNRVASLVMIVTLCLVGFLGFRLFETASTLYENNQSLREGNEQIYKDLEIVTNMMYENSDLLMRFSHYQNNHDPETKQELLCPECTSLWPPEKNKKHWQDFTLTPAEGMKVYNEAVLYSSEDAIYDTKEIATQIRSLTSSLVIQHDKLKYTLLKMRYGDDPDVSLDAPKKRNRDVQDRIFIKFQEMRQSVWQQKIEDKDGPEALQDLYDAIETNIRPELHDKLAPLVASIRYAENGSAGREYGVLHPNVQPTYRSQAGWCAATVQKNWDRYEQQYGDTENFDEYIVFLGDRYCPLDDPCDTMGLNKHWIHNVSRLYKNFNINLY